MENIENMQTSIGTNPLNNDTYMECHNARENNKNDQLDEILHQWKITNFWLGCIGLLFLVILAFIVVSVIGAIWFGIKISDVVSSVTF